LEVLRDTGEQREWYARHAEVDQPEELRIDRSNVDEALATSTDPRVLRLLGVEGKIGSQFGLSPDFAYQIIAQVGNYGDIYNDNLGPDTTFNIDRGPNKAWNLGGGGVLASPPFR
jgi:general L-amino acid transport system substrate-binding protein